MCGRSDSLWDEIDPADYPHPPPGLRVAIASMAYGEQYAMAARVLRQNMFEVGYRGPYVVFVQDSLSDEEEGKMRRMDITLVREHEILHRVGPENRHRLGALDMRYAKLYAWMLVEYDRVVTMDLDITLHANPCAWFHCPTEICGTLEFLSVYGINTGVVSMVPSRSRFLDMIDHVGHTYSYDDADQGFVNRYFRNETRTIYPPSMHLPSIMLIVADAAFFDRRGMKDKVVAVHHYYPKPWFLTLQPFVYAQYTWTRNQMKLEDAGYNTTITWSAITIVAIAICYMGLSLAVLITTQILIVKVGSPHTVVVGWIVILPMTFLASFGIYILGLVQNSWYIPMMTQCVVFASIFMGNTFTMSVFLQRRYIVSSSIWWILVAIQLVSYLLYVYLGYHEGIDTLMDGGIWKQRLFGIRWTMGCLVLVVSIGAQAVLLLTINSDAGTGPAEWMSAVIRRVSFAPPKRGTTRHHV
jgi:glycogenin glucosyltransferase